MSYIGSTPVTQSFIAGTDYFNGTGSATAFTLSRSVVSVNDIQATVNNVVQVPNDAYTVSGTTITFTSAPSAGTNNIYVRYLSTTTQSITPSQNTVSYSTLNSDNQSKLGISFKNRIINGAMLVSQRNGTTSVTASNSTYNLDRWTVSSSTGSTVTVVQSTTAPAGFANSMLYTVTSGSATASNQYFGFRQYIEAYNTSDMNFGSANAVTFTVSFWVRSSLTGIYPVTLANATDTRLYPTSFTVNAANTWEQKTITVAGDTTGTWLGATNGIGMSLQIYPSLGTGFRGTANVWNASAIYGPTGLVDFVATTGNTFYLTGVQLEVGTQATTFDYRSYGTELALCQRYCFAFNDSTSAGNASYGVGNVFNASNINICGFFPISMRIAPTGITVTSPTSFFIGTGGSNTTTSSISYGGCSTSSYELSCAATGVTSGTVILLNNSRGGQLLWSAEL